MNRRMLLLSRPWLLQGLFLAPDRRARKEVPTAKRLRRERGGSCDAGANRHD